MRAYLIDPITKTVSEVDIDDANDYRAYRKVCKLLGTADAHLTSTWLNPKPDDDTWGGEDHLGDYCYSGTFFGDTIQPELIDAAQMERLFAHCRAEIPGDPKNWFQIDADRPAPATFPVSTRAIVVGLNYEGEWIDVEMPLSELQARVRFTRGRICGMTLRDDLESDLDWAGGAERRGGLAMTTEFYDTPAGAIVAICLPWPHSVSGCVEWRLVDWTIAENGHPSYPVLDDGWGDDEPEAWASDYAIWDPSHEEWRFPDDERCDNEDLRETFARRAIRQ